jgi:2-polyprenyl-3-methyl-5-hydroxy-6-metoxy-1,4-benzoquinol methylase
MTMPEPDLHRREAAFHDEWAETTPLEDIDVRAAFEALTAPENRLILDLIGDLRGLRLLDVGAGLGESSVYFALRGASVTSLDISPSMVELTARLAQAHGVAVEALVSPAERLAVPSESFDVVYLANVVHHVEDRPALWREVHRVLTPGGRFFSWDPLAYNPVINVYRRMATEVRTPDERPLTFRDLDEPRRLFRDVGHREFWVATLALFLKYYLLDRVNPNASRYWKRILKEPRESLGWFRQLQRLDAVLTRLPGIRRLAWNMVMWGQK